MKYPANSSTRAIPHLAPMRLGPKGRGAFGGQRDIGVPRTNGRDRRVCALRTVHTLPLGRASLMPVAGHGVPEARQSGGLARGVPAGNERFGAVPTDGVTAVCAR